MRRIFLTLLMSGLLAGAALADQGESLFQQANALYQSKNYSGAADMYQDVLDAGFESGALYYNLGNCHYKMNHIGKAILYYEKARKLMPRDEDVKANLILANLSVVDKVEPLPEFFLVRAVRWMVTLLSRSVLLWIALAFYLVMMTAFILRILTRKRAFASWAILFAVLLFFSVLLIWGQVREARVNVQAVILSDRVAVMSAPGDDGVEVFAIHEGTKVRLDQSTGDWVEIILADGKVGWVERGVLEEI